MNHNFMPNTTGNGKKDKKEKVSFWLRLIDGAVQIAFAIFGKKK